MKPVQHFSNEYLESCREMSIEERIEYLDNFRRLVAEVRDPAERRAKSKLISLKMPEDLLLALKQRAQMEGIGYQTLIKNWLRKLLSPDA